MKNDAFDEKNPKNFTRKKAKIDSTHLKLQDTIRC